MSSWQHPYYTPTYAPSYAPGGAWSGPAPAAPIAPRPAAYTPTYGAHPTYAAAHPSYTAAPTPTRASVYATGEDSSPLSVHGTSLTPPLGTSRRPIVAEPDDTPAAAEHHAPRVASASREQALDVTNDAALVPVAAALPIVREDPDGASLASPRKGSSRRHIRSSRDELARSELAAPSHGFALLDRLDPSGGSGGAHGSMHGPTDDLFSALMAPFGNMFELGGMFGGGLFDRAGSGGGGGGGTFYSASSTVVMRSGGEVYEEHRSSVRGPGYAESMHAVRDPRAGDAMALRRTMAERGYELRRGRDVEGHEHAHARWENMRESEYGDFEAQWRQTAPAYRGPMVRASGSSGRRRPIGM